jgi:outer membrane protein assembly factor BamB
LYFPADGGLHALAAGTGVALWKVQREPFWFTAAVAGDTLFAGNSDGRFYALDRATGAELWSFAAGLDWSAPALWGDLVLAGNRDENFYALDRATGAVRWSFEAEDWAVNDPIVVEGVVYFGAGDHELAPGRRHLYALNAETGAELWRFEADGRILAAPASGGGRLYLTTSVGIVYALE